MADVWCDDGGTYTLSTRIDGTQQYSSAGAYVNFMTADESSRVAAAYGENYARLVELKRKYDPNNVFHVNQNIRP